MTIITKPLSGVQPKKPDASPADDEKLMKDVPLNMTDKMVEDVAMLETDYFISRVRGIGRMTNACVAVSLIALVVLGTGAAIHSYKVFNLQSSYAGMCRIPLKKMFSESTIVGANVRMREEDDEAYQNLLQEADRVNRPALQLIPEFKNLFEFDFDIDVEEESYEVTELPEMFLGRYMHDFKENLTAIVDVLRGRCYTMPLDRTLIPPPRDEFDLIMKMRQGFYSVDYQEIRKNYRVAGGELESLEGLGVLIPRACFSKKTYRLEEMVGQVVVKREAGRLEKYGEFTGAAVIQYHIEGMED